MKIERPSDADLIPLLDHVPEERREAVRQRAEINSRGEILAILPDEWWSLAPGRAVLHVTIGDGLTDRTVFAHGRATDWQV
jgi:hypothetical protein